MEYGGVKIVRWSSVLFYKSGDPVVEAHLYCESVGVGTIVLGLVVWFLLIYIVQTWNGSL